MDKCNKYTCFEICHEFTNCTKFEFSLLTSTESHYWMKGRKKIDSNEKKCTKKNALQCMCMHRSFVLKFVYETIRADSFDKRLKLFIQIVFSEKQKYLKSVTDKGSRCSPLEIFSTRGSSNVYKFENENFENSILIWEWVSKSSELSSIQTLLAWNEESCNISTMWILVPVHQ